MSNTAKQAAYLPIQNTSDMTRHDTAAHIIITAVGRVSIYFIKPCEAFIFSALLTLATRVGVGILLGVEILKWIPKERFPDLVWVLDGTAYFMFFPSLPLGFLTGVFFWFFYLWAGARKNKTAVLETPAFLKHSALWLIVAGGLSAPLLAFICWAKGLQGGSLFLILLVGISTGIAILLIVMFEASLRAKGSPIYRARTAWILPRVTVLCAVADAFFAFSGTMLLLLVMGNRSDILEPIRWLVPVYVIVLRTLFLFLLSRYFMRSNLRALAK